jgi:DNA replication protein DnaC
MYKDYDLRRGDRAILETLINWEPTPQKPSALLYGVPGLGKTLLACATLNEHHAGYRTPKKAPEATKLRILQENRPVYFIQAAEWINLQIRLFNLEDRHRRDLVDGSEVIETDRLIQDLYHTVQLLVIDDVGKEHRTQSGFAEDSLDLLIRTRHYNGLNTIYTSNIAVSNWSNKYQESMQSFITRTCLLVEFR